MEIIDCSKVNPGLYCVKTGDDISSICLKFGVGSNNIVRNNPNIPFYEGEVVKIIKTTYTKHIVKPMETLTQIAQIYNVSIDEIIAANNLSNKRIFVGQLLTIKDN